MVETAKNIQHRHGYFLEIDQAISQFHFVLDQQVPLVAILYEMAKCFAWDVWAIEDPLFHADEIFNEILVMGVFQEANVLVDYQPGWVEE